MFSNFSLQQKLLQWMSFHKGILFVLNITNELDLLENEAGSRCSPPNKFAVFCLDNGEVDLTTGSNQQKGRLNSVSFFSMHWKKKENDFLLCKSLFSHEQ